MMDTEQHGNVLTYEVAKWKGIVKGVHGALNDIGTVPVPPLDADLYETIMAMRAKEAEEIGALRAKVNQLEQELATLKSLP